jgi:hypothetical protein
MLGIWRRRAHRTKRPLQVPFALGSTGTLTPQPWQRRLVHARCSRALHTQHDET